MKIFVVIFMFFIVGALMIVSNNNLALNSDENVVEFGHLYANWLNKIYSNSRTITSEIVNLDWTPE